MGKISEAFLVIRNKYMGKMKTQFVGDTNKNEQKHEKAHKGEAEKVHVAGLKGGQRVKVVEASPNEEAPEIKEGEIAEVKKSGGRTIVEKVRGKKYVSAKANVAPGKVYPLKDAIKLVKDSSYSKFDGTMELHLVVKKTGTSVQLALPHAAGREKKVEVASD